MDIRTLWGISDWVAAILTLPADKPLACRTVLVPRERVAHSIRRELLRMGRVDALAGTRFVPFLAAATEVLREAGTQFTATEGELRSTRLRVLVHRGLPLRYFSPELLRSAPGWDAALTHTISDLEGAGLRPEDLPRSPKEPRWQDIATVWRALEDSAGNSWTPSRTFIEAAALLERAPQCWPFEGPVLACVTGDVTGAKARFVKAIPAVQVGILAGRPLREHYLKRLDRLFGDAAAGAVRAGTPARQIGNERDVLASFLFEPPDVLADPSRPRSTGPDGTVHMEEHAGIESELEAAADWVARQVIEKRTPLEDIAVLVPTMDPLAAMLVERLQRLPWQGGPLPVHAAGGLPVSSLAAGARTLAVVRALTDHLAAEALAEVLPALRAGGDHTRHVTRGSAMDLAYSLGTVGGSPGRPQGALEWSARAMQREKDLTAQLAAARAVEHDEEQAGVARAAHDLERLLADLSAVRPALDGLVGVARLVVDGEPLPRIWAALHGFLDEWLLEPGGGPRIPALLDEAMRASCEDAACAVLAGHDALEVIEERLWSLRILGERFGHPAIYIGTVQDAVGLRFHAVRVIGLAEGAFPSPPREDPVLPEQFRTTLSRGVLLSAADRTLAQLHAPDQVIRDTDGCVVLSASRQSVERTERETASIFIEAAAALGRPNALTKKWESIIPDPVALRRDAFEPARQAAALFRTKTPLSAAAWQDRVGSLRRDLPAAWHGTPALDLGRVTDLNTVRSWCEMDGQIGKDGPAPVIPGLSADKPISASRLQTFLACPHRFLLQEILHWREPAAPPSLREIAPMSYGSLFHRVAEKFFRQHGSVFGRRDSTIGRWLTIADRMVGESFDEFCLSYPLIGDAVRRQQRERLRRDFRAFLEYDWNAGRSRAFVAVERPFGRPAPLSLSLGDLSLFLRGFIDRIDVDGGRTLVRDLKTGRAHPRYGNECDPDHVRDVQIAIYGMVAQQLAAQWELPSDVAVAYAYADSRGENERSFRDDFGDLEAAARGWLETAARLLTERSFPRTPVANDCRYCPFQVVCGQHAPERAARLLDAASGPLASFRAMKVVENE